MIKHPVLLVLGAGLTLASLTLAVGINLSSPTLKIWGAEYGIVENLAACLFGLAAALGAAIWLKTRLTGWAVYTGLLAAAMLRELDWHAKWTSMSLLKLRFYSSPDIAILEKAAGAIVILLLLAAAIYTLRRFPSSFAALKAGDWVVTLIYAGFGFIVASKGLDVFFRLIPSLAQLRPEYGDLFRFCEEMFEVYAGCFFAAAAACALRLRQKPTN